MSNLIHVHKGIEASYKGSYRKVDIYEYGRTGTKSPTLYIYFDSLTNKRYTPYSFRHYGYRLTFNSMFKIIYSKELMNLIPDGIKLMSKVKREPTTAAQFYHRPY